MLATGICRVRHAVYLLTECGNAPKVVEAAVRGNVRIVQLRDEEATDDRLVRVGRRLLPILRPVRGNLIINDRVEVAKILGVGVHLGQTDGDLVAARKRLGPDALIGRSVTTLEQARLAHQQGANYIAASPVLPSTRKPDAGGPWGWERFHALVHHSDLPVYAIGGIRHTNAHEVFRVGAGVAVAGAICDADDPEKASQGLWDIYEQCKTS